MYKHQVVSIHRERSYRSRESDHIVGLCTLEAMDAGGRFHDFARGDDWRVEHGRVVTDGAAGSTPVARCRYWALEEVLCALKTVDAKGKKIHEFYTRHPKTGRRVKVVATAARGQGKSADVCNYWVTTPGNRSALDNLHAQPARPELIACDTVNRCPVIPETAQPVYRAHGADA